MNIQIQLPWFPCIPGGGIGTGGNPPGNGGRIIPGGNPPGKGGLTPIPGGIKGGLVIGGKYAGALGAPGKASSQLLTLIKLF